MTRTLEEENAWAVYIDDDTMEVLWHSEDLPEEIPLQYTASDISRLTRGYVADYPTFTGSGEDGLMVVGFPKDRYWKLMNPSWDYYFIKNAPAIALSVLGINVAVIFLIYILANAKLLRSVTPIANGVQALPTQEPVYVKERGFCPIWQRTSIRRRRSSGPSGRTCAKRRRRGRTGSPGFPRHPHAPFHGDGLRRAAGGRSGPVGGDQAEGVRHPAAEHENQEPDSRPEFGLQAGIQHAAPASPAGEPDCRSPAVRGGFSQRGFGGKVSLAVAGPEHIPACILQEIPICCTGPWKTSCTTPSPTIRTAAGSRWRFLSRRGRAASRCPTTGWE